MSVAGAMYFAIAVILFYGISIALLVAASTLKRSHNDYELKGFLRSYARLDAERRSREKQRIRAVLQRSILMNSLSGRTASPPVAAARDVTSNGTQQSPARCGDAQRRTSCMAGPPTTSGGADCPQFTCVVAADEQPTVHVAISSAMTADNENAAVSSAEPTNDSCLQTVVVVERSPNHAGKGAEISRKRSDGSRLAVQSPAKLSAVVCSGIESGGSKVWPANELTISCVGVWNCRQEASKSSTRAWWSRSRPYSDCTLSRQLSERSFLITEATVSSSMYHLPAGGWGSIRDGRRNTAV